MQCSNAGNADAASVPVVGVVKCVSARQSPFEDAKFANCRTVLAILPAPERPRSIRLILLVCPLLAWFP